jgi:hypothetical protein
LARCFGEFGARFLDYFRLVGDRNQGDRTATVAWMCKFKDRTMVDWAAHPETQHAGNNRYEMDYTHWRAPQAPRLVILSSNILHLTHR